MSSNVEHRVEQFGTTCRAMSSNAGHICFVTFGDNVCVFLHVWQSNVFFLCKLHLFCCKGCFDVPSVPVRCLRGSVHCCCGSCHPFSPPFVVSIACSVVYALLVSRRVLVRACVFGFCVSVARCWVLVSVGLFGCGSCLLVFVFCPRLLHFRPSVLPSVCFVSGGIVLWELVPYVYFQSNNSLFDSLILRAVVAADQIMQLLGLRWQIVVD